MWVNLLLKIIPNKFTISSCLFDKNYSDQLLTFMMNETITRCFLGFTSSVGTMWAWS